MTASATKAGNTGRYKRSFRNYLIDSRFQLKYTGMIVAVTAIIGIALFAFLWRTSREVVSESQTAAEQSKKALSESMKVSEMVKMSITNDPVYKENPELLAQVTEASKEQDAEIKRQQDALVQQQANIEKGQTTMLYSIIGALVVLVTIIGMLGIWFTHKVAGPIFKMKRLLGQVGEGRLHFDERLRKGDELQEFFEAFSEMAEKLRERQRNEVEELERAIELAKAGGASAESVAKVSVVCDEMKRALAR